MYYDSAYENVRGRPMQEVMYWSSCQVLACLMYAVRQGVLRQNRRVSKESIGLSNIFVTSSY